VLQFFAVPYCAFCELRSPKSGPQHVIDKLVESVGKPRPDRYSAFKGIGGESKL
jgi:hypothetical protein